MGIFSPLPASTAEAATESLETQTAETGNTAEQTAEQTSELSDDLSAQADTTQTADNTQEGAADNTQEGPGTDAAQTADAGEAVVPTNEAPAAPAQDAAGTTQSADNTQLAEQTVTGDVSATESLAPNTQVIERSVSGRAYGLLTNSLAVSKLNRRADDLRHSLRDAHLVQALSQVARDNNLSAPMVAVFKAIPEFDQLVKDFPGLEQFNVVVEHPTSANSVVGMESFTVAGETSAQTMQQRAHDVVQAFENVLAIIPSAVAQLKAQIVQDEQALESSDLTEDVLATIPVNSLDDANLNNQLAKLEQLIQGVQPFSADDLQANPEKLTEEVTGLESFVAESGAAIGVQLDQFGLRPADHGSAFEPTQGTFGEKNIDGAAVNLLVARASSLLTALEQIAEQKDTLVQALTDAVNATPEQFDSGDVVYGARDHLTLLSSYTTVVGQAVNESVASVAMVLSIVDSALNIDTGLTA